MKSRMITYEDRMHIARRINTLRLDQLSQIEFGKRVGVGRLVTRWENRAQLPKWKPLES